MEDGDFQVVQFRDIDPGHKVLQIFVDSDEVQLGENGEEIACR